MICTASSRVGASTTTTAPGPPACPWSTARARSSAGSRKASVFPEPVSECSTALWPRRSRGITVAWMGLGRLTPREASVSREACGRRGSNSSRLASSAGRALRPRSSGMGTNAIAPWTSCSSTGQASGNSNSLGGPLASVSLLWSSVASSVSGPVVGTPATPATACCAIASTPGLCLLERKGAGCANSRGAAAASRFSKLALPQRSSGSSARHRGRPHLWPCRTWASPCPFGNGRPFALKTGSSS
mmetsp:Transcript_57360/g.158769  ORF Transcript_57360/g.158769 Transcript_57360/m.158769 type:complete len:245 (+) Transcript_57360:812-1546(+)